MSHIHAAPALMLSARVVSKHRAHFAAKLSLVITFTKNDQPHLIDAQVTPGCRSPAVSDAAHAHLKNTVGRHNAAACTAQRLLSMASWHITAPAGMNCFVAYWRHMLVLCSMCGRFMHCAVLRLALLRPVDSWFCAYLLSTSAQHCCFLGTLLGLR